LSNTNVIHINKIAYVDEVLPNGWFTVIVDGFGRQDIPEGTKVKLLRQENGREYFRILEGRFKGKLANVSMKGGLFGLLAKSRFIRTNIHKIGAKLTFIIDGKRLVIEGLGHFEAYTSTTNPIPKGVYPLEIPDEIHSLGTHYLRDSKYAKTCFRIGRNGDRYLHPGIISGGCITVTDIHRWTDIYKFLRYRRDNGDIGKVVVK